MSNIINNNKQITGTATKDCQQSKGSVNNEQSLSSDMGIEMGTSLSSGQVVNALNNDDAPHSVDNACSEDARITRKIKRGRYSSLLTMTLS
jgi:hypothetical protein